MGSPIKEAAIIDPGMVNPEEVDEAEAFLADKSLELKYILLTHIHIDHTFGIDILKEKAQSQGICPQR